MNKKTFWSVMIIAVLNGCTSSPDSNNKAQVSITTYASMTTVGIYFLSSDSVRVNLFVEQAQKQTGFKYLSQIPDTIIYDGFIVQRYNDLKENFTPPDTAFLSFSGVDLSTEEKLKLQNARSVLVATFLTTKENIVDKQRKITSLIGSMVLGKDYIIADFNTSQFYNSSSWKSNREDNFAGNYVLKEIILHTYREGEFCRIVTLGMGKFCLPDISIKDITCLDQNTFGSLVNAVIATLIQNPDINADSTLSIDLKKISDMKLKQVLTSDLKNKPEQKAEIKLRQVDPEAGDNPNIQFRIIFENPSFSSPQEEQNEVLKKLFGTEESYIKVTHDEEILAASERAKTKLPELQKLFKAGLEPGYSLLLKAPFKTDTGGNEWMWVEVTKWNGIIIEGILQNEPFEISNLKSGAKVKVDQNDIFDYTLTHPDGTSEGNETGRILEKMN